MEILTVDVGTGTQDIYLFRSGLGIENGYKLVLPSPTMIIRSRIRAASERGEDILLSGVTMGGGPSNWAASDHLRSGRRVYATPAAARTFNDDLSAVEADGVEIVSEDEAQQLRDVTEIELGDFDFPAIETAFAAFGYPLRPAVAAIAVFDHGAAPPEISDRQFRFDYLAERIDAANRLTSFAFRGDQVPPIMTRLAAAGKSASSLGCPLVLMDTAPAAVLGATLDPRIAAKERVTIANLGNFHTLAFRLGHGAIEGLFEHHTGLITPSTLETLLRALAAGSLTHEEVFNDHGHGALILEPQPLSLDDIDFGVAITGPRRSMLRGSSLRPYFAVPFGDMMLTGCFGLLRAVAELLPETGEQIEAAFSARFAEVAPWDR